MQIFDTDCFGVMWHGAYVKWLELGRVKLMEERGIRLSRPDEASGFIYPVVEQNFKFRAPAPYQNNLTLTTSLELDGFKLRFHQSFFSKEQQKITMEADTLVMVCDMNWKLQRRIPAFLLEQLYQ